MKNLKDLVTIETCNVSMSVEDAVQVVKKCLYKNFIANFCKQFINDLKVVDSRMRGIYDDECGDAIYAEARIDKYTFDVEFYSKEIGVCEDLTLRWKSSDCTVTEEGFPVALQYGEIHDLVNFYYNIVLGDDGEQYTTKIIIHNTVVIYEINIDGAEYYDAHRIEFRKDGSMKSWAVDPY